MELSSERQMEQFWWSVGFGASCSQRKWEIQTANIAAIRWTNHWFKEGYNVLVGFCRERTDLRDKLVKHIAHCDKQALEERKLLETLICMANQLIRMEQGIGCQNKKMITFEHSPSESWWDDFHESLTRSSCQQLKNLTRLWSLVEAFMMNVCVKQEVNPQNKQKNEKQKLNTFLEVMMFQSTRRETATAWSNEELEKDMDERSSPKMQHHQQTNCTDKEPFVLAEDTTEAEASDRGQHDW